MKNTLVLGALLVIFWLIDSGYFKPMLLGFGAASVVFVLFLHARMVKQDKESFPPAVLSFSLVSYAAWLVWQIVKSNIDALKDLPFPLKIEIDASIFSLIVIPS